jgi:hypothetical protein
MRRKGPTTFVVRSFALVVVLGAAWKAQPQDTKTPYPNMAPVDQYLIEDRVAEIALARSAAPESISRDAEVMVLGRHGYETAIQGKNGFVCIALSICPVQTSFESPWQNGIAERWVESCRRDLLDHIIALHERHLKRLLDQYVRYHHEDRTHLGLAKQTPAARTACTPSGRIVSQRRLGVLHHRYGVLAQYVRKKGTITLMDALRKMSLMPAEMLERSTSVARQKGRLQEGADADIVVFDAATISDHATFEKPMEPSVGVHYLLVAGTVVVNEGKIVPDVFPGRALLGRAALHD